MQYRYELTTDAFAVDRDGYLVVARGDLDRDPPAPSQLTFQVWSHSGGIFIDGCHGGIWLVGLCFQSILFSLIFLLWHVLN